MALDKVVGDITASARKDADQIVQAAEKERESVLALARKKAEEAQKAREKQLEEALKRLRQQELSSAELEAKRLVLNARKEMLDVVFQDTAQKLSKMSDADKARLYARILSKATKVIPDPKVYCPKGESRLISGVAGLQSVTETEMGPGLVLESGDGMVRLDYRFTTILGAIWERELKNVSNVLFG
ncbi:MAG: V-type ATP synthase subunit E family protein [Methanomassiliicoccales archaeon]|jgi:V/A-type H+-transporting ATPase subunit E